MSKKKTPSAPRAELHCRIFSFIETLDPEFAEAIKHLCLEGALSPGHGISGVTFLYPLDDEYRATIIKKAHSEEANDAVKMMESLIVQQSLQSGDDWLRGPVGSRGEVLFKVKSASGKNAVLEGDGKEEVKLEHNNEFKTLAKREGTLAVWNIVSGRPPTTGQEFKRPRASTLR